MHPAGTYVVFPYGHVPPRNPAPGQPVVQPIPYPYPVATASSSLKRKMDSTVPTYAYFPAYYPIPYVAQPGVAPKKPKLESTPTPAEEPALQPSYIHCHQCGKKRERDESAHCSHLEVQVDRKDRPPKTRRCHNKYCRACLKNRYNEDLDVIKANIASKQTGRIGEPYDYNCPKCRDLCNCWRCRKAKGLDPTGRLPNASDASTDPKGKGKAKAEPTDAKPKRAPKTINKPVATRVLPTLSWTKLRTGLTLQDAESRMHIREFVLRFFSADISKAHLEELEQIGGKGRASRFEEDEFVPWISEQCLKSVLLAFLGVLIEEETKYSIKKVLQNGVKDLRATGLSLSKIWQILATLRDSLDASEAGSTDGNETHDSDTVPTFPDPAPLPDSAKYSSRRTRSTGTNIIDTVQMIPVLTGFIEAIVESATIRRDFESTVKPIKDITRDNRDAVRNVNDRWEKVKKEVENAKEQENKREAHKQLLRDLEGANKVAMHRYNQRFSKLGSDRDGRSYFGLSPTMPEVDAAVEFLATVAAETDDTQASYKGKRKRKAKRDEEDQTEWSWFIAVHGKKPAAPPGTLQFKSTKKAEDNDDSDDDEAVDKWWIVHKPAEIRKLMSWLTMKYQLNDNSAESGASSSSDSDGLGTPEMGRLELEDRDVEMSPLPSRLDLLALVANLDDFVGALEYRLRENEGLVLGLGDINAKGGKSKA
ncbi:zf-4CXXC-R1 domain-containing protein [Mycena kentingensis (nom. inval.)]|nr:zf-4CXXC-R1 domain-containing protein [Mycena kentingensis (nom. inval.)]